MCIRDRFSPCQYQRAVHGAFCWMTEGRPVYLPDFLCGYIPPAVFCSIAESERNSKNYVRLFHVEASGKMCIRDRMLTCLTKVKTDCGMKSKKMGG